VLVWWKTNKKGINDENLYSELSDFLVQLLRELLAKHIWTFLKGTGVVPVDNALPSHSPRFL